MSPRRPGDEAFLREVDDNLEEHRRRMRWQRRIGYIVITAWGGFIAAMIWMTVRAIVAWLGRH